MRCNEAKTPIVVPEAKRLAQLARTEKALAEIEENGTTTQSASVLHDLFALTPQILTGEASQKEQTTADELMHQLQDTYGFAGAYDVLNKYAFGKHRTENQQIGYDRVPDGRRLPQPLQH